MCIRQVVRTIHVAVQQADCHWAVAAADVFHAYGVATSRFRRLRFLSRRQVRHSVRIAARLLQGQNHGFPVNGNSMLAPCQKVFAATLLLQRKYPFPITAAPRMGLFTGCQRIKRRSRLPPSVVFMVEAAFRWSAIFLPFFSFEEMERRRYVPCFLLPLSFLFILCCYYWNGPSFLSFFLFSFLFFLLVA